MDTVKELISVRANPEELAHLRATMRDLCQQHALRPKTLRRVVLAVDEVCSNIMEHSGLPPESRFELSIEFSDLSVVAVTRDAGLPFDPTSRKFTSGFQPQPGQSRGFGLYLIHLVSDQRAYERTEDGINQLTLTIAG